MRSAPGTARSRWLTNTPSDTEGVLTILFPYAGGGASAWRPLLSVGSRLDLQPLAVPGRERRLNEAPITDLYELAGTVAITLLPLLHRPFALFGHSLGAVVAAEVARYLKRSFGLMPRALVASCARPPQLLTAAVEPIAHLPDDEFLDALELRTGVAPLGALTDRAEARSLFLPPLRADLAMIEQFGTAQPEACAQRVLTIRGRADPGISADDIAGWRQFSTGPAEELVLEGGHFCVFDQPHTVVAACERVLTDEAVATKGTE